MYITLQDLIGFASVVMQIITLVIVAKSQKK